MSRLGFFCFLGRGHLNPAAALGRCLAERGHHVTVFHVSAAEGAVLAAGLNFRAIDREEADPCSPTRRRWLRCLDTREAVRTHVDRVLREGPAAVRSARCDALVVDQSDLAAGSVADMLRLPFVTLSCAPVMYLDDVVPAPFFAADPATSRLGVWRNRAANAVVEMMAGGAVTRINRARREWRLPEVTQLNQLFSSRGIITQVPKSLDFERRGPSPPIFHTGPIRDDRLSARIPFPWHRCDGRRLIYASMGTIRNDDPGVFRRIAAACVGFDAQLVISLGAGRVSPEDLGALPGDPIVVSYAPQRDLLKHAVLTINCAGLNTVLDSVLCGVPVVAIPVSEDQPGVGARIKVARIGIVLPVRKLTVQALKRAIAAVLSDPTYRAAARHIQHLLVAQEGTSEAADAVEGLLCREVRARSRVVVPPFRPGKARPS